MRRRAAYLPHVRAVSASGSWRGTTGLVLVLACALGGCSDSPGDGDGSAPASSPAPSTSTTDPPPGDSTPSGSPTAHAGLPAYTSSVSVLTPSLRDRISASHRAGCPVPVAELRYLRIRFVGFDGRPHLGEMVLHRDYAEDVVGVFEKLYDARWPIERMVLVDEYDGDDDASMAANNTSAYNCRFVAGTDDWSNHAFGAAVDINPRQNPYVQGDSVAPPSGVPFADLDRSASADVPRGVIRARDVVVEAFAEIGWEWGGDWASAKDYQHFSARGG